MKGRILILVGPRNAAVDQAMRPIASGLREKGWDVTVSWEPERPNGSWDIVHMGFVDHSLRCEGVRAQNYTATLWSVPMDRASSGKLAVALGQKFARVFVSDFMTGQLLGRFRTYPIYAPLVIDVAPFWRLPVPEGPFTVGVFGNEYAPRMDGGKRFHIVEEACARVGLRYLPTVFSPDREEYSLDPVRAVYGEIHVLAHAGLGEPLALPPIEALLCGRPVVSTRIVGLIGILEDGRNGRFFDGSVEDLVEKLLWVQEHYADLVAAPIIPSLRVAEAVNAYDSEFTRLVGGRRSLV